MANIYHGNDQPSMSSYWRTYKTEVFKSYNLNPTFMNQMFEVKTISYDLRNLNVLFQPKWQKVTYGKNTLKNYGIYCPMK